MGYKIDFTITGGYMAVSAAGEQTLANNLQLAEAVVQACEKNGLHRALIDICNITSHVGAFSDLALAEHSAKINLGLVRRAALLTRHDDVERASFFETAARNRGTNIQVFADKQAAVEWLLAD